MTARTLDVYDWAQIHARMQRERRAKRLAKRTKAVQTEAPHRADREERLPFSPEETMAVGVALFGECRECGCLLDIDGTCPDASKHEKHVCPDCGAESREPLSVARPCLFESEHGKKAAE